MNTTKPPSPQSDETFTLAGTLEGLGCEALTTGCQRNNELTADHIERLIALVSGG
ncbi:MAG: hypothetical protein NTW21_35955 [Verrucomicrobia bacterium]|nr:hypothetical protein [Verrucomicrobiota bacterium]